MTNRTFYRDGVEKDETDPGSRKNCWTVDRVRCLDCRSLFNVDDSCVSRDINRGVGSGNRVLLVFLPEVCPDCRGLKGLPTSLKPARKTGSALKPARSPKSALKLVRKP